MFDRFMEEQSDFVNLITESVNNDKISHAYFIETGNFEYALDLAIAFSKFLLSRNNNIDYELLNNLIDNGSYNDFMVVNPDGLWIKKDQIIQIKNSFLNKSANNNYQIYIINGADKLNLQAANSMLKFLEEPAENIIGIFLAKNRFNVIDTILSRCQIYSLSNIRKNLYDEKVMDIVFNLIESIEKYGYHTIVNINKLFLEFNLSKEEINEVFNLIEEIYIDSLEYKYYNKTNFTNYFDVIKEISENNEDKDLSNKIIIINRFKDYLKVNVNLGILLDKFVIEMSGGVDID